MLEKIKKIIEDEKLLWQAERQPAKKDIIFGCFLFIPLCCSLYLFWFKLDSFAKYMERFPILVQLLSAAMIVLTPILLFGSILIHIFGDEKIN